MNQEEDNIALSSEERCVRTLVYRFIYVYMCVCMCANMCILCVQCAYMYILSVLNSITSKYKSNTTHITVHIPYSVICQILNGRRLEEYGIEEGLSYDVTAWQNQSKVAAGTVAVLLLADSKPGMMLPEQTEYIDDCRSREAPCYTSVSQGGIPYRDTRYAVVESVSTCFVISLVRVSKSQNLQSPKSEKRKVLKSAVGVEVWSATGLFWFSDSLVTQYIYFLHIHMSQNMWM